MRNIRFWVAVFIMAVAAGIAQGKASLLERIWADDVIGSIRFSPDGRHYAYIHRKATVDEIVIVNIASNSRSVLSSLRESSFGSFVWVDGNNIAVREIEGWNVMIRSYDLRARKNRGAFNEPSRSMLQQTAETIAPSLLSGVPAVPEIVLMNVPTSSYRINPLRRRGDLGGGQPNAVQLNVQNGRTEVVAENPGNIDYWLSDSQGNVRIGVKLYGNREFVYRERNGLPFESVSLPKTGFPVGFLPGDQRILYLFDEDSDADTVGFRIYDLDQRDFVTRLIRDQTYDMAEYPGSYPILSRDPATGHVLGLRYPTDRHAHVWLDSGMREWQKRLDMLVPDLTNSIVGLAADNRTLLFVSGSDIEPGRLLKLDLETAVISSILDLYPQVKIGELSPIRTVTFPARDGQMIHGYLTLPLNHVPGQRLPFVTIVHGGPMARDEWGFQVANREAQFFAAKGFAVLQVNYRGSTGYGRKFQGDKHLFAAQYGVEDVVDGTRWAIAQGYADPNRCVIYGASFGGYSAMASAVHEPDLYQLAIGSMGVYDWFEIIRFDQERSHPLVWEILRKRYGDYEGEDREALIKWSPARNAAKIRAKVLLMHGANDRRVDIRQFNLMSSALSDAGITHETYRYTLGGHGFDEQRGWVAYYRRLGEFVDKYLP